MLQVPTCHVAKECQRNQNSLWVLHICPLLCVLCCDVLCTWLLLAVRPAGKLMMCDKTGCVAFLQDEVKILRRIGEGAFGEVSLATCAIFGSVAVKWLKVSSHTCHMHTFVTFCLCIMSWGPIDRVLFMLIHANSSQNGEKQHLMKAPHAFASLLANNTASAAVLTIM